MDASHAIAEHSVALHWDMLDAPTRHAAITFLHDSLCVGIAGARAPYAQEMMRAVLQWAGEGGTSLVLGRDFSLPPSDAAFLNAFQIHAQEFDCVHEPAVVHPMATILAALLSQLGRGEVYSGPQFLTALVAGVDVAAGLGLAATTPLRFFRPATAGIFGCVTALANLRALDVETTRNALGYALAFAAGTMQAHVEGKPALPVQIAQAARSSVQAIELAAAGMPGPLDSIEGAFGYLPLFEAGFDIQRFHDSLRQGHRITQVSWKPFPTGRAAHGAIVATQQLMRDHGVTADNLERLRYQAPPLIHRLVGRKAISDMRPAYARLCFPWLGAVVLTRGTVSLQDFTPAHLEDSQLLALAQRIEVVADDNPDPAAFVPATATAYLRDGRMCQVNVSAQFGSPAWPLSRAEHLEKARACLAFAEMEAHHQALTSLMERIADVPDMNAALNAVLHHPIRSGFQR